MNKIIKGKKYDTKTAKLIWLDEYRGMGDYCTREGLYQKKNKEFFLCIEGSPFNDYDQIVDINIWNRSFSIIPFTDDEAKAWLEIHVDGDTYEELFGEVDE